MIIRPARMEDEDIDAVAGLWKAMVNELAPQNTPNVDWWKSMCLKLMRLGIYYLFVAEVEGKIVGFIDGMAFPEPSTGKIHGVGQHLFVLPEYRGKGIGARLYRKIIRLARQKGVQAIEFFCFYGSMGTWQKKGYKPIRVLMRRD